MAPAPVKPQGRPVPVWAWGAAIVVGLVVGYVFLRRSGGAGSAPSDTAPPQGGAAGPSGDSGAAVGGLPPELLDALLGALGLRAGGSTTSATAGNDTGADAGVGGDATTGSDNAEAVPVTTAQDWTSEVGVQSGYSPGVAAADLAGTLFGVPSGVNPSTGQPYTGVDQSGPMPSSTPVLAPYYSDAGQAAGAGPTPQQGSPGEYSLGTLTGAGYGGNLSIS